MISPWGVLCNWLTLNGDGACRAGLEIRIVGASDDATLNVDLDENQQNIADQR
jgi:hypothetical protein